MNQIPITPLYMKASDMPIGIVGAGAMGAGITLVAASHGHPVILADAQSAAVARARADHVSSLNRDVEKGRKTRDEADETQRRITYVEGVDASQLIAFSDCWMVIEAIVEQLAAKQALFRALESVVATHALLASNTSSLSIAALGGACARAERVLGVHFFNPATLMPLVEIIPAISTAPDLTILAENLVQSWGKTTVRAKDTPGFLVNRVARPFYGESLRLLDEGRADAATIDWAMTTIGGFRMGPFALMDMIGNDVNFAVSCSVYENTFHDPRYRPSVTQQRMVEAGWLGQKTRRGYYTYGAGATRPTPVEDVELGTQIVQRVLAMLVNEAVSAQELGIASAADIEIAMTKGVNYPRGLLAWGDQIGAAQVLSTLESLQHEYGDARYRPAPRLRRIATTPDGRLLDG